jgi:hypothetical protein
MITFDHQGVHMSDDSLTDSESIAACAAPILKVLNSEQIRKLGMEVERLTKKADAMTREANAIRGQAAALTGFKAACEGMATITRPAGGESAIAGGKLPGQR